MAKSSAQPFLVRWRKSLIVLAGLFALSVAGYFVLTSSSFLRSVVLPRVAKAVNADITVSEFSLHPFSQLRLRQLRVTPAGQVKPLLEADEVFVRYQWMSLLTGNYAIPEVRLVGPKVEVVQTADGRSNLDAIGGQSTGQPARRSSEPLLFKLGRLTVSGGEFRLTRMEPSGGTQVSEVRALELTLEDLAPGADAKGKVAVELTQTSSGGIAAKNADGRVKAKLDGALEFQLTPKLLPTAASADLRLTVEGASGVFGDLAGIGAKLTCKAQSKAASEIQLKFEQQGKALGEVAVRGRFDWDQLQGDGKFSDRLEGLRGEASLDVVGVDRSVLNLFGAPFGLDFADSSFGSWTTLEFGREGAGLVFSTKLDGKRIGVRTGGQNTPPIDVTLTGSGWVDTRQKTAKISSFQLIGKNSGERVLDASLKGGREIRFWWGDRALKERTEAADPSSISISSQIDLAKWGMFLGSTPPTGRVTTELELTTDSEGKQLSGQMSLAVTNLAVVVGSNRWERLHGSLSSKDLALLDYRLMLLNKLELDLKAAGKPLLRGSGNVSLDLASRATKAQVSAESELVDFLRFLPVPDLQAEAGKLVGTVGYNEDNRQTSASLSLSLSGVVARYGQFRFRDYGLRLDSTLALSPEAIDVRSLVFSAQQGTRPGGSFDLSGRINRASQVSDWSFLAANLNELAMGPFLAPALAPLTLRSAALDAKGTAHIDLAGRTTIDLKNANLVKLRIEDPQQRTPGKPLDLGLGFTGSMQGRRYELSKGRLALTPTERATNVLNFEALVDLSTNQPQPSTAKLTAEALDLTALYAAYAARDSAAPPPPAGSVPGRSPGNPPPEAPALVLPVRQLVAEAKIDRLYMRDLEMGAFVAKARLSNDVVHVSPCSMKLNGAPVSASVMVDFSIPGYAYRLKLDADGVPVAPVLGLMDFAADNPLRGEFSAALAFDGAGTTAASLAKKLQGQFSLGGTNLNLAISSIRSRLLKSIVNVVVGIPSLVRNPTAGLGNILADLAGAKRENPGWVDEVVQSPINAVLLRGAVGNGRVELQQSLVQSPAFRVEAVGNMVMAPVLTNSTVELPVQIALRAPLAEKIGLKSTEGALAYVKLPDFLTVKGSLGDPKTQIKALALAGMTARASAGLIGNTGNPSLDKASSLLGTVGGLLGGGTNAPSPPTTNSSARMTNAPGRTNPPPSTGLDKAASLLNTVGGLLGGAGNPPASPATNAPTASTNTTLRANPAPSTNRLPATNRPPGSPVPPKTK